MGCVECEMKWLGSIGSEGVVCYDGLRCVVLSVTVSPARRPSAGAEGSRTCMAL